MGEDKNLNGALAPATEERTYTQEELDAIVSQYKIKLSQLQRQAQEEINKRDLTNFYQTLSILFEIVRNKDSYSPEFSKFAVDYIEKGIKGLFETEDSDKENEKSPL